MFTAGPKLRIRLARRHAPSGIPRFQRLNRIPPINSKTLAHHLGVVVNAYLSDVINELGRAPELLMPSPPVAGIGVALALGDCVLVADVCEPADLDLGSTDDAHHVAV